jgi:hypothetical protein
VSEEPSFDLVILESPYAANEKHSVFDHVKYAQEALLDSLRRGEAPIASHLLYTQVLDDRIPEERKLGIGAGLAWRSVAQRAVFYTDLGWSSGMLYARNLYDETGVPYTLRTIR